MARRRPTSVDGYLASMAAFRAATFPTSGEMLAILSSPNSLLTSIGTNSTPFRPTRSDVNASAALQHSTHSTVGDGSDLGAAATLFVRIFVDRLAGDARRSANRHRQSFSSSFDSRSTASNLLGDAQRQPFSVTSTPFGRGDGMHSGQRLANVGACNTSGAPTARRG